ncbi:MAG: hypothetical protein R2706_16800 [Acidimicrobiales bacterium]
MDLDGPDYVSALISLLEEPTSGPVNLTAPNPVSNADFAKALGHALHHPSILPVPAFGPRLLLEQTHWRQLPV